MPKWETNAEMQNYETSVSVSDFGIVSTFGISLDFGISFGFGISAN